MIRLYNQSNIHGFIYYYGLIRILNLISICIVLEMWKIYRVPENNTRNDKRIGIRTKTEK